jgi:hypothetical protein
LVLAHELASGAALRPEVGAMYGPAADSEVALAVRLIPRIPAKSVLMADRNFGVFGFFLGLIHVRLQTWAPFTCQIYVNGHDFHSAATILERWLNHYQAQRPQDKSAT